MALFDWVDYTMPCPTCGEKIESFKTNDREGSFSTVAYQETLCFYASCKQCNTWVEFIRKPAISIDDFTKEVRTHNTGKEKK